MTVRTSLCVALLMTLCAYALGGPPPAPPILREDEDPGGEVTALDPDAVTIRPPGKRPRRLLYCDHLAAGRVKPACSLDLSTGRPVIICAPGPSPDRSYLPEHLRVGDIVSLSTERFNGHLRCDEIMIRRRPGGRVPPAPGEDLRPGEHGWADVQNTEQDFEERGTPLPQWYLNRYPVTAKKLIANRDSKQPMATTDPSKP